MLVLSIKGSFLEAKTAIQKANKLGKIIEFRLDLFEDLSRIGTLKNLCLEPVIFTLRKASQGGNFSGNEKEREKILLDLLMLNPKYIDLESDTDPLFIKKIRQKFPNLSIICSYHDFEKTPTNLEAILNKMERTCASIYKITTFAQSSLDSLRMLIFIQQKRKSGKNIAGMCMGKKGEITRILAPVVDNLFTYASLSKEKATASGQLPIDLLEKNYHFSYLNSQTAIYALIGDPIDKSIGYLIHNHIFHTLKHNAIYVNIPLIQEEIPEFFLLIKQLPFQGFSITMPLKEKVISYLDYIDSKAKAIGAINTLVLNKGKWEGLNTDGTGALDAIETKGKIKQKKIVIFGAGGVAKSIAFELLERGGEVLILNRTKKKAEKLSHQLGCQAASLEEWKIRPYDILINATSVGMSSQSSKSLVPEDAIDSQAIIFDVVFNPKETHFLNLAKNKGCQIVYGFEMFTRQAIKQLEIWFKQPLNPEDFLREIAHIYNETMSS